MTDCGCRIDHDLYEGIVPEGWQLVDMTICHIVYCPLHANAEAMRDCLRQCAEGAFIMEQRGVLISRAKQGLAQVEGKAG